MDYSEENNFMRKSQLRPPSRIPTSPAKSLTEITESENNTRAKMISRMPPPSSLKHKLGASYGEPEPKQRKTLAERAGEPRSFAAATPSSRPVVKAWEDAWWKYMENRLLRFSNTQLEIYWKHPGRHPKYQQVAECRVDELSHLNWVLFEKLEKTIETVDEGSRWGFDCSLLVRLSPNTRYFTPENSIRAECFFQRATEGSRTWHLRSLASTNTSYGSSRNPSFSSSISSRTPSVSSRNTSNGSFSSSVGPGHARSYSANINRPQGSTIFSQSTNSRPTSILPKSQPATSPNNDFEDDDVSGGKRKGTQHLAFTPFHQSSQRAASLQWQKLRTPNSVHSQRSVRSMNNHRDVSVSTAMSRLRIDSGNQSQQNECQAITTTMKPPPSGSLSNRTSINTEPGNTRVDSSEMALVLFQAPSGTLVPKTPSQIPVPIRRGSSIATPITPCKAPRNSLSKAPYMTQDSNNPFDVAWDVRGRLEDMEAVFLEMKEKMNGSELESNRLEEVATVYKARIAELETIRAQLTSSNSILQTELDTMRAKSNTLQQNLLEATTTLDAKIRAHRNDIDDITRDNRNAVEKLERDNTAELDRLIRLHRDELEEVQRRGARELEEKCRDLERKNDAKVEEERSRRLREVQDLESQLSKEHSNLNSSLEKKDQDIRNMRAELENLKNELDRERNLKSDAQKNLAEVKETMQKTGAETSSTIQTLESTVASLRARIHFLESGSKAQSDSFAEMEARLQDAVKSAEVSKQKLIKEETLRRILFNQVQELKGNIRVMCRVRPVFNSGMEGEAAQLKFPDVDKESKELEILGKEEKSSLGTVSRKAHSFTFDRVFGPESQNQEVFEEISQLVQSALDGYNVCIFCYGQTGSGKTHTMSSVDGMIPRATHQIYETATSLKEKGWTYTMEGSFVEVYNEEIHDLLGSSRDSDKKKHEIRHDDQKKQTTITGLKSVALDSPDTVESMLKQASANRSVAATKSNERSSRSHSVFILKLVGKNSTTNETSEGTLNLVDLAGSERLKQSGAEGDRKKETANINKSLSCLGDVIGALGQGKEGAHIPYRNSKLTYLLQYSLGGNSKTLMFVMASPMEAHLTETLTSLKFATKSFAGPNIHRVALVQEAASWRPALSQSITLIAHNQNCRASEYDSRLGNQSVDSTVLQISIEKVDSHLGNLNIPRPSQEDLQYLVDNFNGTDSYSCTIKVKEALV
ncbi:hypothetical protein G7Y89_g13463 [Cudoniella acicularis]|uniref:Kinesin motor domain-containing protein n=1 Tax=Cudoniella acicularis TaxID=354080 RepID=A0A8H4R8H8_9HELO|nr:hypothetical protein G7Y89_g13463 [Cudoniella acicularis]